MKIKNIISLIIFSIIIFSCSTSTEIDNIQKVSRDGLILFFDFEGNKIIDKSNFENYCEVHGTQIMRDRVNNSNSFAYFDGVDDYIKIKNSEILTPLDKKLTISFWFSAEFPGNKFILYKGSSQYNREYAIGIREDSLLSFQINHKGDWLERSSVTSLNKIDENKWTHVVCIWDGETQKIYVNSEYNSETKTDLLIQNFDSDLYIGTYGGSINQYSFHGVIDNLLIFNRMISEAEIRLLMDHQIE